MFLKVNSKSEEDVSFKERIVNLALVESFEERRELLIITLSSGKTHRLTEESSKRFKELFKSHTVVGFAEINFPGFEDRVDGKVFGDGPYFVEEEE